MPRPSEDPILQELRENYIYARDYWREPFSEGDKDIKFQTEGPWDGNDKADRAGRVTLWLDETNQYLNQIVNEFRQSERGIKVIPKGNGANDATALFRQGTIRGIEYESKAQQAYINSGECMVRRGYGFHKLRTDFEPGNFNRVIIIDPIPNPNVILLDPDFKKTDGSDANWAFEIEDGIKESEFRRRFGKKATITDFDIGKDHPAAEGTWVSGDKYSRKIRVASYWRRVCKENPIYLLETGQVIDPRKFQEGQLQFLERGEDRFIVLGATAYKILDERPDNEYVVTKYMTNGLEILETEPTDWEEVPIIPMFGKIIWKTYAGESRRIFESAMRHVRDGEKAFCYCASAAVERLAQDPKAPYEGWQGQFNTNSFQNGNDPLKNPARYVEFAHTTHPDTGTPVADKPTRNLVAPAIDQFLAGCEFFRRSIQAGMGGSPLPTSAQRQNQKSGVALDKIEQSNDQGNFHFTTSYNEAVERTGRMINRALSKIMDTPRDVMVPDEAGKFNYAKINQIDALGNKVGFHTSTGDHSETISVGPSMQSQRDAADDFLDKLAASPEVFPRIADLVVKLKNLGPIGDQIAQRLAPPGADLPPQVAAQLQQGQQIVAQLQEEIRQLKAGDAIKKYTVDEQEKTKRVLGLIKVDQQDAETRLDAMLGTVTERLDRMHEGYQALLQRIHEKEMAASQAANAQAAAQQEAQNQPANAAD